MKRKLRWWLLLGMISFWAAMWAAEPRVDLEPYVQAHVEMRGWR